MPELIDKILSDDEMHTALLAKCVAMREKTETFMNSSNLRNKMNRGYRLFRSDPNIYRKKEPWMANIFVPLTHQSIATIHPRLNHAVYGVFPLFELSGETEMAHRKVSKSQEVLNSMLYQNDFYTSFNDSVLAALIFGTGFLKYVVTRDGGKTRVFPEYCDTGSIGVDPQAKDFQTAKYCYHDLWKPIWHLIEKEKDGMYKGVDRVQKDSNMTSGGTESNPAMKRMAEVGLAPADHGTDELRVTEYYFISNDPLAPENYKSMLVTTVNDVYIIRAEENPYGFFPFERVVPMPIMSEFYGMSVPMIIEYLQQEVNEKRNQLLDAGRLTTSPVWTYVANSLWGADDDEDPKLTPGAMIEVMEPNAITPLQFNFAGLTSGWNEYNVTKEDIKDALGIFDYSRGVSRPGDSTATEIVQLINEGNMRFLQMVMNLEHYTLKSIGKNMLTLMKKSMLPVESVKITALQDREGMLVKADKGYMNLKPDEIDYNYEMRVMASAAFQQQAIESQKMIEFAHLIMKDPEAAQIIDKAEFYKLMARSMRIRDLSFFKKKPDMEELPQEMRPEMMAALLNRGVQGMGSPEPQLPVAA